MAIPFEKLKALRHKLHANPEVSGNEFETAKTIQQYLENLQPNSIITNLGGTGILAEFDSGKPGPVIMIRSELDALPIQEINEFDYKSVTKNASHKCGHDGHSTILCGVAERLSTEKIERGKALLLFQPAEEIGEGAQAVMADKKWKNIHVDYAISLHNVPGYNVGEIVVHEGVFTPSVNSIILQLTGRTSHAAEPENGHNPAMAVAEIIEKSLSFANNIPSDPNLAVVTPIYITLGDKNYGTSAGYAEVHFTVRCWDDEKRIALENKIINASTEIAKKYSLKLNHEFTQTYSANKNHKDAVNLVLAAVKNNNYNLAERGYPFKWGEDFGLFTQKYKGCMFGLGAGENCPALHNPDYDFPDELIEYGANMFYEIIREGVKNT